MVLGSWQTGLSGVNDLGLLKAAAGRGRGLCIDPIQRGYDGPSHGETGCRSPHNSPLPALAADFLASRKSSQGHPARGRGSRRRRRLAMSYRDGSQSAEKAGLAGSLLCKALGAHPGISRGVRRVNSKVGSPPWTPILEMASGFLPGEQSCRCLWPSRSSLPPFPFLQTLKGSEVLRVPRTRLPASSLLWGPPLGFRVVVQGRREGREGCRERQPVRGGGGAGAFP